MLRRLTVNPVDSDVNLTANSKSRSASQSAVKAYVDNLSSETTGILYIGDKNTNGSWRMRASGNFLITERLVAGVWVEKDAASGQTITR